MARWGERALPITESWASGGFHFHVLGLDDLPEGPAELSVSAGGQTTRFSVALAPPPRSRPAVARLVELRRARDLPALRAAFARLEDADRLWGGVELGFGLASAGQPTEADEAF